MSRLNAAIAISLTLLSLFGLLSVAATPVAAQTPDLAEVDFSDAAISLAGPRAFYIRNIQTGTGSYSVRLSAGEDDVWRVVETYREQDNLLPQDVVLDVASVKVRENNTIEIDGVFLEDDVYSVRLRPENDGYALLNGIRNGTLADINVDRAEPIINLVVEETVATRLTDARKRIEELRAARDRAQEEVSRLSARNMGLIERNEELSRRNERLRETRDKLQQEITKLRAENDQLKEDIAALEAHLQSARENATEDTVEGARADAVEPALIERIARQGAQELDELAGVAEDIDGGLADIAATLDSLSNDVSGNHAEILDAIAQAQAALVERLAKAEDALTDTSEGPEPVDGEALAGDVATQVSERVAAELQPLENELSAVRAELEEARTQLSRPAPSEDPAPPEAPDDSPTESLNEDLRKRIADLRARQDDIRREVLDRVAGGSYVETVTEELPRELTRGFSPPTAGGGDGTQLGSWSADGSTLVQQDPEQYFAKYLLGVPQNSQRTLYRFTASSLDEGWVGLGLHIFVSNVDKRGYGLGDSLLIWFTRDPSVYGTQNTFLQVYRSSDDVNMGRVAGAMISEPIAEPLTASVLYEPDKGYLTVAVNGEDKLRYRAWFDIDRGVQVALRSLGRARFSDFSVRTEAEADAD